MGSAWSTFKRFLTAEEVPRWFGLSIVLIYLVGLGAVAQLGIVQARREAVVHYQRSSRYTVRLLAERLSSTATADFIAKSTKPVDSLSAGALQHALREFADEVPARWLRVVDGRGRVIASTDPRRRSESPRVYTAAERASDSPSAEWQTRFPSGHASLPASGVRPGGGHAADTLVRARISPPDLIPDNKDALFLEVLLPAVPWGASSPGSQARTLAIVLVVLGALFVVYRCLREQLRGMSRIADRLQLPRERLEDDLGSLRVADTLDSVTTAWNELVDLTQRLLEMVRRSDADAELSRVLKRSGGGALADALSALPEGIVYITDEVRFEYVNATACRLFGWTGEEAGRTTLADAEAEGVGGRVLDLLREALQPDGTFDGRTETLHVDDEQARDRSSYQVRIIPLHREHRQGECIVLIRDVSQQLRAERAREEFITQVTHELRTPLTNIRAYTETLSSGMFEDPNVITECYNVITKETRRLSRLVEDVLSVSQMQVGTIDLQVADVDLKTLLKEGLRDVRGLADEKNIDLQLVLPSKVEPIRADRDKLAVVVNNLLANAIKYTAPGGNVVLGCQFTGDEVVVSVKDNGIGIDPADHARVFEKFQRAHDPDVQNQTGSGIGLYTAREIVRRHRGDIELISAKGKGSTFLVRLPRRENRSASLTTKKKEA